MAVVMKSSFAKSLSVRKHSLTLSDPIVLWIRWNSSFTFLCIIIIINGWMLHVKAFGALISSSLQTLSITSKLWDILSVITKSMFARISYSVDLRLVVANNRFRVIISFFSESLYFEKILMVGSTRWILLIVKDWTTYSPTPLIAEPSFEYVTVIFSPVMISSTMLDNTIGSI